ncbi:hypothetical protein EDD96_4522 [Streptomyces sp. Ag109_G2-6]|nr:hypothetical protein [Streptomyces sp. Ag109_G2-6]RPF40745.1 hypothetical protein EDD96_4522 [Streptomyces sp. Ag109_G2-6]
MIVIAFLAVADIAVRGDAPTLHNLLGYVCCAGPTRPRTLNVHAQSLP